jgi:hypothetical protein
VKRLLAKIFTYRLGTVRIKKLRKTATSLIDSMMDTSTSWKLKMLDERG